MELLLDMFSVNMLNNKFAESIYSYDKSFVG